MSRWFRRSWFRWFSIGLLSLLGLGLYANLHRRQKLLEAWQNGARGAGWVVEASPAVRGPLSTRIRELRLKRAGTDAMQGIATDVVIRGSWFTSPRLNVETLKLVFTGEPMEVFDIWPSTTQWDWLAPKSVVIEYTHELLGHLLLEGVTLKREDSHYNLHADRLQLGNATWHDVSLSIRRRNRLLEVGVGTGPIAEAPVTLGYFPSSRGASQWTVSVAHQPARAVAQRLGWDIGAAFDASFVGGSVTLVVPDKPTHSPRGSIQAVIDNWPKPSWPDAEALLGSTTSFFARLEPSPDTQNWALPEVDVSQALFSLTGTGRLSLGNTPSLSFDTQGTRTCAQLEANLAPSIYADQTKRFLTDCATSMTCAERRRESVTLRLQFAATDLRESKHHVAWHMDAGCGLSERTSGNVRDLDFPIRAPAVNSPSPR
ncbi:MAG TPA: hypothetical protein VIV60_36930 [Polyangiaceae bacterium]